MNLAARRYWQVIVTFAIVGWAIGFLLPDIQRTGREPTSWAFGGLIAGIAFASISRRFALTSTERAATLMLLGGALGYFFLIVFFMTWLWSGRAESARPERCALPATLAGAFAGLALDFVWRLMKRPTRFGTKDMLIATAILALALGSILLSIKYAASQS
jgi:hypothetical protein